MVAVAGCCRGSVIVMVSLDAFVRVLVWVITKHRQTARPLQVFLKHKHTYYVDIVSRQTQLVMKVQTDILKLKLAKLSSYRLVLLRLR